MASSRASRRPDQVLWDVIVVGTGMGGSTAGYELARLGHSVLFVEKGRLLHAPSGRSGTDGSMLERKPVDTGDEAVDARLRAGHWPWPLQARTNFGDLEFYPPLGCGSGGSTALYAAALERFMPADFSPRANFPDVEDSTLPEEWPISYGEFRPYYERAEQLFRVRGTPDPLARDERVSLREPPALSPRDQYFFDFLSRSGLHPYRVHVGYEFVAGCSGCAPGICRRGCKNDAATVCLLPAIEEYGASFMPQCEAVRVNAGRHAVQELECRWSGEALSLRAKVFVLAAGAYMTPILLLNSPSGEWPAGVANRSGLVGRNLMLHVSDFIAISPGRRLSNAGPHKSLALNDFYQCDGEKLGTFQSAGAAVEVGQIIQYMRDMAQREPAWWRKLASPTPRWWRKLSSPAVRTVAMAMYHLLNFKDASIWATIVEDLPYHENRVIPDARAKSGLRLEYRYPEELRKRVRSFRQRLAEAFGSHRMITLTGDNNLNYGHACGTCRFGKDPRTSVLDSANRAHGLSNLYVVDASFFPSSGGTNPSLTIAANALRVAEAIHQQL